MEAVCSCISLARYRTYSRSRAWRGCFHSSLIPTIPYLVPLYRQRTRGSGLPHTLFGAMLFYFNLCILTTFGLGLPYYFICRGGPYYFICRGGGASYLEQKIRGGPIHHLAILYIELRNKSRRRIALLKKLFIQTVTNRPSCSLLVREKQGPQNKWMRRMD